MSSSVIKTNLQVLIVGAGIAGLAAAIAFRKAGHKVTILERSNFSGEVGAAVTISPNGTRVLQKLGFDLVRAGSVPNRYIRGNSIFTLKKMWEFDLGDDIEEKCGAPYQAIHRGDLHAELLRQALHTAPAEHPVELLRGVHIAHVDVEEAQVVLDDGTDFVGDLLIGADGLHSVVRAAAMKEMEAPIDSTWQTYRFLLPLEDILDDEDMKGMRWTDARILYGWESHQNDADIEKKTFVWYPCRDNKLQNFAAFYQGNRYTSKVEDFEHQSDKEKVLDLFSDMHPALLRMVNKATKVLSWRVYERIPLETFIFGRTILVGDAGHPMTPFTVAGATQALEDAGALLALFSHMEKMGEEDIHKRMKLFDQVRLRRATRVQTGSSTDLKDGKTNPLVQIKEEIEAKDPFPKGLNAKEKILWDFQYNVFEHCEQVIREHAGIRGKTLEAGQA